MMEISIAEESGESGGHIEMEPSAGHEHAA